MNVTASLLSSRSRFAAALVALAGSAMLASCASTPPGPLDRAYRLTWNATRASDHLALYSTSMTVVPDHPATLNARSAHPVENVPAFARFTARLSTTKTPDVLELVTRADLREAIRNKKGKLKITKRNIGALLPIRPGETQLASLPTDPVHLEVRLERQ